MQALARQLEDGRQPPMLDNLDMVFIERTRSPVPWEFNVGIGSRIRVCSTATGQVVMAHLPREERQLLLDRLRRDERVCPLSLHPRGRPHGALVNMRERGYAMSDAAPVVRAIAAPVFSSDGAFYALNVVVHGAIPVSELERAHVPGVISTGREISEALGHRGPAATL